MSNENKTPIIDDAFLELLVDAASRRPEVFKQLQSIAGQEYEEQQIDDHNTTGEL